MRKTLTTALAIVLVLAMSVCLFAACNGGGENNAPAATYTPSDETMMALNRIKGASYTADIASLVGANNTASGASASSAAEDARPLPTTISDTTVDTCYKNGSLTSTSTYWISVVENYQEDADKWGAETKTSIFSFIDKAVVFDKWIYTPSLQPYQEGYLSFMVSYDSVNDVVTLYSMIHSLNAYRYYFDEDGDEVLEAYTYERFDENEGYVAVDFTKYVKGKCYTTMRSHHGYTDYCDIQNVDGKLNWLSYELNSVDNYSQISYLKQDGAKALFYSTNEKGDYSSLEYIYNGDMLFRINDYYTTDCSPSSTLHPVSNVEYALNLLDGYEYVYNTTEKTVTIPGTDESYTTSQTGILKEYIGDKVYSATNPNPEYYPWNTSTPDENGSVFYFKIGDHEPYESPFYVDIDSITTNSTYANVEVVDPENQMTIDNAYYHRLMSKLCETNNVNKYEFMHRYGLDDLSLSVTAYNGWLLFGGDDLVSCLSDDDITRYFPDEPDKSWRPISILADFFYNPVAPDTWGQKGGVMRMYDYAGLDMCDSSHILHIKDAYKQAYYDFRSDYNNFDATIANISILGTTNVFSQSSTTAITNSIKRLIKEPFLETFDFEKIEKITPDQLVGTTAAMLNPTFVGGSATAEMDATKQSISIVLAETSLTLEQSVLLQSGSEYRAELGLQNGNAFIPAFGGTAAAYNGNGITITISGKYTIPDNLQMLFGQKYDAVLYVSKKIDGKWVKISGTLPVTTTQNNADVAYADGLKYIVNNFGEIVTDTYTFGYGALNSNNKLQIIKNGTDEIAPTITFAPTGCTLLLDDESLAPFVGEGLDVSALVQVSASEGNVSLNDLKGLSAVTDNLDGTISICLNNFKAYTFVGDEDDAKFVPDTAKVFTDMADGVLGWLLFEVTDSAGNTTQVVFRVQ